MNRTLLPKWRGIVNGPGCLDMNNQSNLAEILCRDQLVILENRVVMASVVRNYDVTCQLAYINKRYFVTSNSFLLWEGFHGINIIDF